MDLLILTPLLILGLYLWINKFILWPIRVLTHPSYGLVPKFLSAISLVLSLFGITMLVLLSL